MKPWAVLLVALVGCYQPSAAEQYNAEWEALNHLDGEIEPLQILKNTVGQGEANNSSLELWEKRKGDYEQLLRIREAQLERVKAARLKLGR